MQKAVQICVKVPVEIRNEDGRIITSCFLLDTAQQGSNKPAALDALTDAVRSFLISCFDNGSIDRMLYDHDLVPQDVRSGVIDGPLHRGFAHADSAHSGRVNSNDCFGSRTQTCRPDSTRAATRNSLSRE